MIKQSLIHLGSEIFTKKSVLKSYRNISNLLKKQYGAVIVNFHQLFKDNESFIQKGPSVHTHVDVFEEMIENLTLRFKPISLDYLVSTLQDEKPLEEDSLVITFDDGYLNNYQYAMPILKKYDIRATLFIATGFINTNKMLPMDRIDYALRNTRKKHYLSNLLDNKNYSIEDREDKARVNILLGNKIKGVFSKDLNAIFDQLYNELGVVEESNTNRLMLNWKEVNEMISNNIDIGSHAVSHVCLTRIPDNQAIAELEESRKTIFSNTSYTANHFAFPNGMKEDFNDELRNAAKLIGYNSVCSVERGINYPGMTSPFELKRIGMYKNPKRSMLNIENYFIKSKKA